MKFTENDAALDKQRLRQALGQSGDAQAQLIEIGLENGKLKYYKPHLIGLLGCIISHEAYHCGEICVALTESGHQRAETVLSDPWDWNKC